MTLIAGIFQRAEDKEYAVKNPIHNIHKKDYYKKCKVNSVDDNEKIFTDEEIKKIVSKKREKTHKISDILCFIFNFSLDFNRHACRRNTCFTLVGY
jgi:hypothetical protein